MNAAKITKAAAVGALAMNGGEIDNNEPAGPVPECPNPPLVHYHDQEICEANLKPHRPPLGSHERRSIIEDLKNSGVGATLVPNQKTVICPLEVQSLENKGAVRGLDTTWLVENTATTPVVISLMINGVEWSPFKADVKPMDDPLAILQPGGKEKNNYG